MKQHRTMATSETRPKCQEKLTVEETTVASNWDHNHSLPAFTREFDRVVIQLSGAADTSSSAVNSASACKHCSLDFIAGVGLSPASSYMCFQRYTQSWR